MLIEKLVLGAMALAVGGVLWAAETPKREALFFIGAHPDDSEGFAATVFLLRDKYDIHVIDLTRGELGLGMKGYEDGTTGPSFSVAESADVDQVRRFGMRVV